MIDVVLVGMEGHGGGVRMDEVVVERHLNALQAELHRVRTVDGAPISISERMLFKVNHAKRSLASRVDAVVQDAVVRRGKAYVAAGDVEAVLIKEHRASS